jgi:hypothetical protein
MKRRKFLRDITLGIASCLLPEILQPVSFEIKQDNQYGILHQLRNAPVQYYEGNELTMADLRGFINQLKIQKSNN